MFTCVLFREIQDDLIQCSFIAAFIKWIITMLKVNLQCHIPYNIIKVLLFVEFYKTVLFGTIKTRMNGLWDANKVELYTFVLKICTTNIGVYTIKNRDTKIFYNNTDIFSEMYRQ